jgi:hypothetical protein
MDIDINIGIILGWASLNWSIVVDNVLGEHASHSLVEAIAPMSTWRHDTSRLTTNLFEDCEVRWYIKLDVKAAALVRSFDHG